MNEGDLADDTDHTEVRFYDEFALFRDNRNTESGISYVKGPITYLIIRTATTLATVASHS